MILIPVMIVFYLLLDQIGILTYLIMGVIFVIASLTDYFGGAIDQKLAVRPFVLTDTVEKYDVFATLKGGGKSAQSEALRHGIAKALLEIDVANRPALKKAGFLTRDARAKERKKYGRKAARASFQFSKR